MTDESFLYEGKQVPLWTEKQLANLSRKNLKQREPKRRIEQ